MAAKAYRGMGMEGLIARWYSTNTGKDLREIRALAARIVSRLPGGANVLEVAPGPGYLAIELAKAGDYHVVGLDISHTFVRIAAEHTRAAGVEVDFRHGDAADMPLADGTFQFLVCRAAFKNFSDPLGALREMRRVLAPGGTALVIDLRRDATLQDINAEVAGMGMNAMNAAFTRWVFRVSLLKRAYTCEELTRLVVDSGFVNHEIERTPIGVELWLHK